MGEIRVRIKLENNNDLAFYEAGIIKKNQLRQEVIDALVDTGAVEMLLPQDLVEKLGLKLYYKVIVTLADERKTELWKAGPLWLTVCNRGMITDCLVGPPGCEPLLGQVVMEKLDLIPNPRKKTITPNPQSPYLPTLKMK
mgnify:CR=1 FL=1